MPISGLVSGALCSVLLGFAGFRHEVVEVVLLPLHQVAGPAVPDSLH